MEKNYFSPSAVGFYIEGQERPEDSVKISAGVEAFLRECVIWGADGFTVAMDAASVTYPKELNEYASQYGAPFNYPEEQPES